MIAVAGLVDVVILVDVDCIQIWTVTVAFRFNVACDHICFITVALILVARRCTALQVACTTWQLGVPVTTGMKSALFMVRSRLGS